MNVRLQTLMAKAESHLSEQEKEGLADLVEAYLSSPDEAAMLSDEELADLDRMLAEPLELATPAEVEAVLARYGTS